MDGNGAYHHYRNGSILVNESAIDMDILDIIRSEWNRIRNAEQEKQWQETRSRSQ